MDTLIYCRQHNLVPYRDFIAEICSKNLVFIGESDHFSSSQQRNEEILLENIVRTRNSVQIATEVISDFAYNSKREMLARFCFSDLAYLPSENRKMAEQVNLMTKSEQLVIVIVGSSHLTGPFSVGALLKRNYHENSITVFLEEFTKTSGIYRKQTSSAKDYIVVGSLTECNYASTPA